MLMPSKNLQNVVPSSGLVTTCIFIPKWIVIHINLCALTFSNLKWIKVVVSWIPTDGLLNQTAMWLAF